MAHDVFISYSSKDKPAADAACAVLESKGVRCWIAPRDITPGADWGESIVDAIHSSRAFLLIFSGNANTSQQIKREVERAVNRGLPVIPMRIENVLPAKSLEYFLSTPHWLDAFTPPLQQHLDYLSDVIRAVLDGAKAPEPRKLAPADPVFMDRRVMIGGGVGAVALIGLLFWLFSGPPTFEGKWTASRMALDGGNIGTSMFQYLTSAFAKSAVAGNQIKATLEVDDVGAYTLITTGDDHGTVSLSGDQITFISDLDHASTTSQFWIVGSQNTQSYAGMYGGKPGDEMITLTPPAPMAQTNFVGKIDANATGPTAKVAAHWRSRDPNSSNDSTLNIAGDGHYTFHITSTEKGIWEAKDGKLTRTPQNGVPINATYHFDGSSQVTVASPKDTFVWKKD
ncbi:MAG TPA: toll/interleukin-1 receptor domain-containing protein [Rhizomicrobium sp.]|nr:toll/interleukin-1 receptor domain-containing protein [Rhizomicrobium sp.]